VTFVNFVVQTAFGFYFWRLNPEKYFRQNVKPVFVDYSNYFSPKVRPKNLDPSLGRGYKTN